MICGPCRDGGPKRVFAAVKPRQRRFQLILIKPSHYADDGYVVQWARAVIPSNTLAVLYSLGRDSAERAVLGPDTAIDITVDRRDQQPGQNPAAAVTVPPPRRVRPSRHRRRAVEPVSARARHRAPVPRRRRAGDDRRLPRVRLPRHAAGAAGRPQGRARHGRQPVRRRARRAHGRGSCATPRTGRCSRSTTT